MRLQQEKMHREKALEEATWRFEHGEAPSEEAVKDLSRQDRKKVRLINHITHNTTCLYCT